MPTTEERQEIAAEIVTAVLDHDKDRAEALAKTLSPRVPMAEIIRRYHDVAEDTDILAADAVDTLETVSANGAALLEVLFAVVEELADRLATAKDDASAARCELAEEISRQRGPRPRRTAGWQG